MGLTYDNLQTPDGSSQTIKTALDDVFARTGTGQLSTAMFDTVFGLNHRQQPNSVPVNKDYYGLTFFTRPNLNMKAQNLRQDRLFSPLLSTDKNSLPRALRALLDTRSALEGHSTSLVDDYQAFIPILTNQLENISGWPDIVLPTWNSKPGVYQEEFGYADGTTKNFKSYDIRANFRNIQGDPITAMFLIWVHYAAMVAEGILVPYPEYIINNTVDYNTRIYRLVLDPSREYIQKIAACGAAFPIDSPIGNAFNFDSDGPINQGNNKISVSFRCFGAMYNDPILFYEFNQTVINCNSDMAGTDAQRASKFHRLLPGEYNLFNHRGYPFIDVATGQLQWWVRLEEYNQIINGTSTDPLDDIVG